MGLGSLITEITANEEDTSEDIKDSTRVDAEGMVVQHHTYEKKQTNISVPVFLVCELANHI